MSRVDFTTGHTFAAMSQQKLKLKLEFIWWGFTLIVVAGVLIPVWLKTEHYPFYLENALYIVIAITFTRYAFLLRHTFIARMFWPKFVIIALTAILVFVLATSLGDFTNYIDEVGLQTLVDHHPVNTQYSVIKYIRSEMVFFGVLSILGSIALCLRMIISIWRMHNTGKV